MRARIMSAIAWVMRRWIAPIGKTARQPLGDAEPPLGLARSMTPPSEVRRPPSKAAVIFLRRNGWKRESREFIVRHGGCGSAEGGGLVSATKSYAASNA